MTLWVPLFRAHRTTKYNKIFTRGNSLPDKVFPGDQLATFSRVRLSADIHTNTFVQKCPLMD